MCILPLAAACERQAPHVDPKHSDSDEPIYDPDVWDIGTEVVCSDPTEGFDRLDEQAMSRGIDLINDPNLSPKNCPGVDGGVVASDLDDDGDIDLMFHSPEGFPHLFTNDGTGRFDPQDISTESGLPAGRRVTAAAAHDLDGDRLPELFIVGDGFVALSQNLGSMEFTAPELIHLEPDLPYTCFNTIALGDIDGDNDLDIFLPALDAVPSEDFYAEAQLPESGTPDLLFLNDTAGFLPPTEIIPWEQPNLSMFAVFTDRDMDGDKDLLVGTDPPNPDILPMAFYRNDGTSSDGPRLSNDATEISAALNISAMGMGSADLNEDGLLDYCLTDVYFRIRCLMSDGDGGYYDGGAALGLTPDLSAPSAWRPEVHEPAQWTPWSAELQDLDNDGYRDLVTTAGPPADGNLIFDLTFTDVQPDIIFRGKPDGTFEEDNGSSGFSDASAHYGMAAADLDRDGALDLVVGTWSGAPSVWSNPCTPGAWLTIEPLGPPGNSEGLGVMVAVTTGTRTDIQELHGLRSVGQSPSELYFGLGDASTVDHIEVTWPDGTTQSFENAPTRRTLYVRHPEAVATALPASALTEE